ncbi:MAG: adenylate/guanylate cyclase domain-containing protein [Syntrophobacteraceae bacterium]
MPALLIEGDEDSHELFVLSKPQINIGRNHAASGIVNDVNLPDRTVSRRHARIVQEGESYFIEDLGSENRVIVNDRPVRRSPLGDGDRISIGRYTLVFQSHRIKSVDPKGYTVGPLDPCKTMDLNYLILHRLSDLLVTVTTVDEFLNAAMDLILSSLRASTGMLLLRDTDGTLREAISRNPSDAFSRSMVEQAMQTRTAIMTGLDYSPTETMMFRGIRSALCAPLIHEGGVLGAVYVESPQLGCFSEDSLVLLTVTANQVASGLEKAALNEQLYKEILIRKNLERFLSPNVARRIAEDSSARGELALQTDRLQVSVLFADIEGFTLLSERLDAADIADLLTRYFTLMTDVLFRWEGTLDKYLGDGLLAIFGAPFRYADHGLRAVRCALEMLEKQKEYSRGLPEDRQFNIRIGVNTGEVVAGYLGSPRRMEYTVLGETVVIANRLQALARPGTVYVGRPTYELVKDYFPVEHVDRIPTPKGRNIIDVYCISG